MHCIIEKKIIFRHKNLIDVTIKLHMCVQKRFLPLTYLSLSVTTSVGWLPADTVYVFISLPNLYGNRKLCIYFIDTVNPFVIISLSVFKWVDKSVASKPIDRKIMSMFREPRTLRFRTRLSLLTLINYHILSDTRSSDKMLLCYCLRVLLNQVGVVRVSCTDTDICRL